MLQGIDMLLFDIQDIGARYYTYVSTMAFVMRAAGEADIPFLVLDRPNPIGGEKVQGNVLDPDFSSFVGLHPVPMRHGMTTGELARLYRSAFGVQVDLDVVPMQGWNRSLRFDETGLPWVDPSPNIPNLESATHYPGTCLFEGTGLSMGRGTDRPFQQVGAPGLDADALARALHEYDFCDIFFEAVQFTPEHPGDGKFDGEQVSGIRLRPVGAEYDPTRVAVAMLIEARRMIGDGWLWRPIMDLLAGTDRLRLGIEAGAGLDDLTAGWDEAIDDFLQLRDPHLLY
jgi:beta-N-acetylhexosaminidase